MSASSRLVLFTVGSAVAAFAAQPAPAQRAASSFELPRLKAHGNPHEDKAISKAKVTVDELATEGKSHLKRARSQQLDYLVVEGGKSFSRPVRGGPKDTVFVSFFVYGSDATVIDVAGAKLQVREMVGKAGYAQLQLGTTTTKGATWRNFGGPIRLEQFDGQDMAALPVLTVRIDRGAGLWDLYVGSRLAISDLPLAALPKDAPNQFTVRAGSDGALVNGLISADENPLFTDENANGIDDDFEKTKGNGTLQAKSTAKGDRATLARQFQQDQQAKAVKPWAVQRPLPDEPKGKKPKA